MQHQPEQGCDVPLVDQLAAEFGRVLAIRSEYEISVQAIDSLSSKVELGIKEAERWTQVRCSPSNAHGPLPWPPASRTEVPLERDQDVALRESAGRHREPLFGWRRPNHVVTDHTHVWHVEFVREPANQLDVVPPALGILEAFGDVVAGDSTIKLCRNHVQLPGERRANNRARIPTIGEALSICSCMARAYSRRFATYASTSWRWSRTYEMTP